MNKYLGHHSQICGVEEVILAKGKGKGMTLLEIRNGKGLHITLAPDRCLDIPRISFNGANMGYFAPSGYVAPAYYDREDDGFLKSFNAGFMTTCGIDGTGVPCVDDGEKVPMHGTIGNTPCENYLYEENEKEIIVKGYVSDGSLFGQKYYLTRTYIISKTENSIVIKDSIKNIDSKVRPCMLLYHINMGYPLLSENAKVVIPANSVTPRNQHAKDDVENCLNMEVPQHGYEERCYYHDVKATDGLAKVGIYNPDIKKGLVMEFNKETLDKFTEWKMMGETEYVLGLEPSNCTPDGRDVMRKEGILKFIEPGKTYETYIKVNFAENEVDVTGLGK